MERKLIERDIREDIAFWIQVQQDAHWRGGEVDLKIAEYAAKQRRRLQDKLLNMWDGKSRKAFEQAAVTFANEKQPTGVGAGELITIQTKHITDIVARNGGICNECVS